MKTTILNKSRLILIVLFAFAVIEFMLASILVFDFGGQEMSDFSGKILAISMPISFLLYLLYLKYKKE